MLQKKKVQEDEGLKKKLKLFSVRVKELFEPIVLRNRSLSNARYFYNKNRKIVKGNLYSTKNRLSRNEMWCAADNYSYMSHMCEGSGPQYLNYIFGKIEILVSK